jgi:hypothetical protein
LGSSHSQTKQQYSRSVLVPEVQQPYELQTSIRKQTPKQKPSKKSHPFADRIKPARTLGKVHPRCTA